MALLTYAAVTKPYLTTSHVSRRLAFGHAPSAWSLAEWGAGGFSDESSITVRPARGEGQVWRRPNERYLPVFLRPWFNSGRSAMSVWAAFSSRGRNPLVRIGDRLFQVKNMDINHEYLLPLVERRHGEALNFILMEDNCGPHRAINVAMYPPMLPLHGLLRLDWAPQSPDMNPIENVWSVLETRLRAQVHMPTVSSRRHVRSGMACRTVFFFVSCGCQCPVWLGLWCGLAGTPPDTKSSCHLRTYGPLFSDPRGALGAILKESGPGDPHFCSSPCTTRGSRRASALPRRSGYQTMYL